jgi:hypothetical protein
MRVYSYCRPTESNDGRFNEYHILIKTNLHELMFRVQKYRAMVDFMSEGDVSRQNFIKT